jgi:hypothetical protein
MKTAYEIKTEIINAAALAEYETWKAALELERWTRYEHNPKRALDRLIARERFTAPHQ